MEAEIERKRSALRKGACRLQEELVELETRKSQERQLQTNCERNFNQANASKRPTWKEGPPCSPSEPDALEALACWLRFLSQSACCCLSSLFRVSSSTISNSFCSLHASFRSALLFLSLSAFISSHFSFILCLVLAISSYLSLIIWIRSAKPSTIC